MIATEVFDSVTNWLKYYKSPDLSIIQVTHLSGGSINHVYRLKTTSGDFFLKINNKSLYPGMFECEARGLKLLESTNTVIVPKVLKADSAGQASYLLLSYEKQVSPGDKYWELFSQQLASMHKISSNDYGLNHDNYIGSLPQKNTPTSNLYEFIITHRIEPLVKHAYHKNLLKQEDIRNFEILYNKLDQLLPVEKPALIHGDLWNGNLITNKSGEPVLIDPAVYYGHREYDIAMTRLFGGFPSRFYQLYNSIYPLESGWESRIELNQLYPLLVHVVLFGESYSYDVRRILKKYM